MCIFGKIGKNIVKILYRRIKTQVTEPPHNLNHALTLKTVKYENSVDEHDELGGK